MGWGWSPDFCLACDRQTTGGVYCSQACRLADLERASPSVSPQASTGLDAWPSAAPVSGLPSSSLPLASLSSLGSSGFYLPPPIDFSAYRRQPPSSSSSGSTERVLRQQQQPQQQRDQRHDYMSTHPWPERLNDRDHQHHYHHGTTRPSLHSSSSQTSLVSLQSSSTVDDSRLSEETRTELRAYASCFDRLRDLKQRYISRS
ncbi:MAG: hypothetical protein M1823_001316 [Watsoniomyces obsoletus]|nr:MAG: hypothetical protein M1823_001316 [Watsoniomyces obsoletus]